jgi:hypothetical protein
MRTYQSQINQIHLHREGKLKKNEEEFETSFYA